jgi:hypothetical protein
VKYTSVIFNSGKGEVIGYTIYQILRTTTYVTELHVFQLIHVLIYYDLKRKKVYGKDELNIVLVQ